MLNLHNLKQLRINKKLTQSDVAYKLGVATSTYSMYERGEREPDPTMLSNIADLFKVSTDYLLGRNVPKWATQNDVIRVDEELKRNTVMLYDGYELTEEDKKQVNNVIRAILYEKLNRSN